MSLRVVFHRETACGNDIGPVGVARDFDGAVVLPLVGVADFGIEGGEFFERFLFGVVAHPRQRLDVVMEREQDVFHHLLHARFGFGRKSLLDVFLAEGFAEIVVGGFDATFPVRLHLGGALQVFLIEREILLHEGRRERRRGGKQNLPGEISFPVGDRSFFELLLKFFEEFWLIDVDRHVRAEAQRVEISLPVETGCEFLNVIERHLVIGGVWDRGERRC